MSKLVLGGSKNLISLFLSISLSSVDAADARSDRSDQNDI